MRRSSKALLAAALACGAGAAPARAKGRIYDPEIALLLLDVQKESVELVGEELQRQAEWLNLGSMRVLVPDQIARFEGRVRAGLTVDSDVAEDYRRALTDMSPGDAPDIDRLIAEVRRYHDLRPGPPLERVPLKARPGKPPEFFSEFGPGADVEAALKGTPLMDEPAAYAERRFGTTGPFLRRRKWNLDFYLGSFSDLAARYLALGYRRAYRLRAPYVSFGRSAYVLSPEPGLRPRLVYCEFYGQDLFLHTRAQWAELALRAEKRGPPVATLTCPACSWTPPGVRAMRALLATVPYAADAVVAGYDYLFTDLWSDRLLGAYENDYWRLAYYRVDAAVVAVVQARHTDFGEILAASLTPLVRRGASAVYFAGPAAAVDPGVDPADLAAPTGFATFEGGRVALRNVFARRGRTALFAGLPSPLLATREWLKDARGRGVVGFDAEMPRLADAAGGWTRADGNPVDVGVGAVLGQISSLHPEEDRAFYTVEFANQSGKESAKTQFRDAVLAALKDAAREKSR